MLLVVGLALLLLLLLGQEVVVVGLVLGLFQDCCHVKVREWRRR